MALQVHWGSQEHIPLGGRREAPWRRQEGRVTCGPDIAREELAWLRLGLGRLPEQREVAAGLAAPGALKAEGGLCRQAWREQ